MDNNKANGMNDMNNSPAPDMGEGLDEIIKAAEEAAEKSIAQENAADEVFEVQALPENEAMMAYSAVSSDMPAINAALSAQPFSASRPEPSQMESIAPVSETTANLSVTENTYTATPTDAHFNNSMPGIAAEPDAQLYVTPIFDSNENLSTDVSLHNAMPDGSMFSAARKTGKRKNTPTVSDAYAQYPDAPLVQKSTGRPLTAEEARKFYATQKPVEKVVEEQAEEEQSDNSSDKIKLIIYIALLAVGVIALVACVIGLLNGKPINNNMGGFVNNSSSNSVGGQTEEPQISSSPAEESAVSGGESSVGSSQSVTKRPADSGSNGSQGGSTASVQTAAKPQQVQTVETTRQNSQSVPSVTTKTPPVIAPPASVSQTSSSSVPQMTVKPQTNASQSTVKPQTTPPQTTVKPQTTPAPQTTVTLQTEPPAPAQKLYSISCSISSEWQDGGNTAQGASFVITNNSGKDVDGWTLVMEIDGLVSISCWSGDCNTNGNTLTITNLSYNSGIANGGTLSIGCNIVTKNGVKIKSATLNGAPVQIL